MRSSPPGRAARDKAATAAALQAAGVPAAPVAKPEERIDHDPATAGFGLWPTVRHTKMGDVRVDGLPVHFSETDWEIERGAPCLGEHTEAGARRACSASPPTRSRRCARRAWYERVCQGIRVLELSHERGAFAGKLLADMGADVILVEPPGGSALRALRPVRGRRARPRAEPLLVALQHQQARHRARPRRGRPAARRFRRLVASADVVLEGEDPGRLAALGLDYAELAAPRADLGLDHAVRPREPGRADLATDLTLLAGGGPVWSCGYDDHSLPPVRGGRQPGLQHRVSLRGDVRAHRACSTAAARARGQLIDVSMHAAANVTTEMASYSWLVARQTVQRQTGRHAIETLSMPSAGALRRRPLREHRRAAAHAEGVRGPAALAARARPRRRASRGGLPRDGRASASDVDLSKIGPDDEITAIFARRPRGAGRSSRAGSRRYDFFVGAQRAGLPVGVIYAPEEAFEDPHFVARGFQCRSSTPSSAARSAIPARPTASRRRRGGSRAARRGSASTRTRCSREMTRA